MGPVAIWSLGGVSMGRRMLRAGPWQSCQLFCQPRPPALECRSPAVSPDTANCLSMRRAAE